MVKAMIKLIILFATALAPAATAPQEVRFEWCTAYAALVLEAREQSTSDEFYDVNYRSERDECTGDPQAYETANPLPP